MQIKHSFEELKEEVKNELINHNAASLNTIQGKNGGEKNNGLMDVDMLDVADLEKERGDPSDH